MQNVYPYRIVISTTNTTQMRNNQSKSKSSSVFFTPTSIKFEHSSFFSLFFAFNKHYAFHKCNTTHKLIIFASWNDVTSITFASYAHTLYFIKRLVYVLISDDDRTCFALYANSKYMIISLRLCAFFLILYVLLFNKFPYSFCIQSSSELWIVFKFIF